MIADCRLFFLSVAAQRGRCPIYAHAKTYAVLRPSIDTAWQRHVFFTL